MMCALYDSPSTSSGYNTYIFIGYIHKSIDLGCFDIFIFILLMQKVDRYRKSFYFTAKMFFFI